MSTNSPAAAPESHSPSPSKIDRWMPPGVGAAMLASGYVVAWRFFRSAQGAAMPVNIIAVSMVYVGLLVMAMMGPVAAVAIVKRLPVRSWSAGPKALTVIMPSVSRWRAWPRSCTCRVSCSRRSGAAGPSERARFKSPAARCPIWRPGCCFSPT